MFSRFTHYFDEVARRGSIRRASERLHIAPSAIDRHILRMEEDLGIALFERLPQGLRLTAAGELLVDAVRRWRRDFARVKMQIDDLQGLRRGEVTIALVEGSGAFLSRALKTFSAAYPAIAFRLQVAGSQAVVDQVLSGEADLGLSFNPPETHALRLERSLIYQLGAVVPPGHRLAGRPEVMLNDLADEPLIIPDESISLRGVLDAAWANAVGGSPRYAAAASSIALMKSLVQSGLGIGMLTAIDVIDEAAAGALSFVPLSGSKIPLSVLSVISASGRTLSVPASLLLQHLAGAMLGQGQPHVG